MQTIFIFLIQLTASVENSEMLSSPDQIVLLTNMLKFAGGKKCLDVGNE